jgi:hypothetical protein
MLCWIRIISEDSDDINLKEIEGSDNQIHYAENGYHHEHADKPPNDMITTLFSAVVTIGISNELEYPDKKINKRQGEQHANDGIEDVVSQPSEEDLGCQICIRGKSDHSLTTSGIASG